MSLPDPVRPRLWLHVGDHKTGSTSIQRVLYERRWSCAGVQLDYPPQFNDASLARSGLKPALRARWRPILQQRAAWLAASPADVAVMSAEHFSAVDPARLVEVLGRFMPDHLAGAGVVAYVRPHAQSILSHYAQRTKCGTSMRRLDQFVDDLKATGGFRYQPRFEAWRRGFGDRFVLRPMLRARLRDGDVVADFLHLVLGGARFTIDAPVSTNEALSLRQLAAVREVQGVLRDRGIDPKIRVSVGSRLGVELNRIAGPGPAAAGDDRIRLDRATAETIRQHWRDDAVAIDAGFLAGEPGAPLTEALDEAIDSAAASAQPHLLADHADAGDIARLQAAAGVLAAALDRHGRLWKRSWQASVGHRPQGQPQTAEEIAGVARVEAALADLVAAIAAPAALGPQQALSPPPSSH